MKPEFNYILDQEMTGLSPFSHYLNSNLVLSSVEAPFPS